MEKLKIEVKGPTGSAYKSGELYSSGVIKYADGSISHLSAEISHGRTVMEYIEPEKKPEPKVEIKKEEVVTSPVQTAPAKKKKTKG